MHRPTRVTLDLAQVTRNVRRLRAWTGTNFFCPMVKANAYGHGDVQLASTIAAAGVDALGVTLVEEGVGLREGGVRAPILVFASFDADAARAAKNFDLTPVVGRPEHLAAFAGADVDVHLKFNLGMQRLGFDAPELDGLRAWLSNNPGVRVKGLCAHLTHGEDAADDDGPTARQLRQFDALTAGFTGRRHAHKSASLAALGEKVAAGDVGARPGIGVYGIAHEGFEVGEGLRPVLSWTSELVAIHELKVGEAVGYGARWRAARPSRIGVVPVGYGDGYSRRGEGRAFSLVGDQRVPVVGSVCMDYHFVDVTDVHLAKVGDPVVLIGRGGTEEITAADLAGWTGTIAYEVVTAISRRVPRRAL